MDSSDGEIFDPNADFDRVTYETILEIIQRRPRSQRVLSFTENPVGTFSEMSLSSPS